MICTKTRRVLQFLLGKTNGEQYMEQEALFLFIVWRQQQLKSVYARDTISYVCDIRRASIRKALGGLEVCKRLPVDFDPMSKQICFVVGYQYTEKVDYKTSEGLFAPLSIFETEDQAKEFFNKISGSNLKQVALEHSHRPTNIFISSVLIMEE